MDGADRTETPTDEIVDFASCDVVDAIVRLRKALTDAGDMAEERVSTRDALRAAYDLIVAAGIPRVSVAVS